MSFSHVRHFLAAFLLAVSTGVSTSLGCSVCGCSLSSDWGMQSYSETAGTQLSIRYEYFDQTDLRSGTGSVERAALTFPTDNEIQQNTTNRNVWLDLDSVLNAKWALSFQLPYHDRDHSTIAPGDTEISTSRAQGLGDVRLLARYQMLKSRYDNVGFQFGLTLPTGRFNQNFATGPQAGALLDRGLQLGTGTTDLLLGTAWFARPLVHLGVFAQALLDQPLAQREGFIPSTSTTLNTGLRWLNTSSFTPQLQLNVRFDGREHGLNSDRDNSGGTVAFLSPGLTMDVNRKINAFAFFQVPVYQRLNGFQLEPHWLITFGARFKI